VSTPQRMNGFVRNFRQNAVFGSRLLLGSANSCRGKLLVKTIASPTVSQTLRLT